MKQVSEFAIIGNPQTVEPIEHPFSGKKAVLLADGSIYCEGEYFAPEPHDGRLYEMRREFDRLHGLNPAERRLIANREIIEAAKQGLTVFC